jgi:hypothetical protein
MSWGEQMLQQYPDLGTGNSKFEAEYRAFCRMHEDLLKAYEDQWVAVHNEQVIDADPDRHALTLRVWAEYGTDVPILFHPVLKGGRPPVEVPL